MAARIDSNASYFSNIKRKPGTRVPDLTGGACLTPIGMMVMDAYIGSFGGKNGEGVPGARVEARRLCDSCTRKYECGRDTLESENPPGAWGGMYGGMTPRERRTAAFKLEAEREERNRSTQAGG